VLTDVSEECIVFIIRVEEKREENPQAKNQHEQMEIDYLPLLMLVPCRYCVNRHFG
jgi:hypothetical protein